MRLDADVIQLFACPQCSAALALDEASGHVSRALTCRLCRETYPIVRGIPRFVPSANYAESFGMQWNRHRRTQLDSFTGLPISRTRVFETTRWPEQLRGQIILEAGSGAGRFTEVLISTGAFVYSFDYSAAVEANASNNEASDQLCLFQADIFRIPLKRATFDKVFCFGVLQHTPDPEAAFRSLATYVRPGGELAIDIYAKRATAVVSWRYILRPVTRRMDQHRLYRLVERSVDLMLPLAVRLRRHAGRVGARLLPISEHSNLGLSPELTREWAILDTFDMYAPAHDHPKSIRTVKRWFAEVGFAEVQVGLGPNGVVGRGRRPR